MCGSTGQVREMRHKYIVLIEKGTLGGKRGTTRKQNAVRAGNGLRLTTIWPVARAGIVHGQDNTPAVRRIICQCQECRVQIVPEAQCSRQRLL